MLTAEVNAYNPTKAEVLAIADALEPIVRQLGNENYKGYPEKIRSYAEGGVKYSLTGINDNGIEVYETSEEIMALSWSERKAKYLDVMKNEYQGRTAKFERNGHIYYAQFDRSSIRKPIYGDKRSSPDGVKALIKAGADGDVFDLVENSQYYSSKENTKDHTNADYFDYFVKTVQIDGKVFDLVADVEKKYGVDGGYVYTLSLVDNKKIKASPAHGRPNNGPVQDAGNASADIIPQTPEKVKRKNSIFENFPVGFPIRSDLRSDIYGKDVALEFPIRKDIPKNNVVGGADSVPVRGDVEKSVAREEVQTDKQVYEMYLTSRIPWIWIPRLTLMPATGSLAL